MMNQLKIIMYASLMFFIYGCGNADVESEFYRRSKGWIQCECGGTHDISKVTSKHGVVKDAWCVCVEWICRKKMQYYCETYEVIFKNGEIAETIKYAYNLKDPHRKPWWLWGIGFILYWCFILLFIRERRQKQPYYLDFYLKVREIAHDKFKRIINVVVLGVPGVFLVWLEYYFAWPQVLDTLICLDLWPSWILLIIIVLSCGWPWFLYISVLYKLCGRAAIMALFKG